LAVKFNQKDLDRMMEEAANWQPPAQAQPNPQELLQKLKGRTPPVNQVNANGQD